MKSFFFFILLFPSLFATEYAPWFSPPWEFQARCSSFYQRESRVQTPKGSFHRRSNDSFTQFSLGITPWPYWNAEVELLLSRTDTIPFSYEAALATIRYQWLDDIVGDPCALASGITLAFPGNRYLHNFTFPYHGDINAEFHTTLGKEWRCWQAWVLGGFGIANRGNGWLHGILDVEFQQNCWTCGAFTEALFGLGPNDIIPSEPFPGYASIDHRNVDIGGFVRYQLGCLGTISILGWYNAYAHNFIENYWGIGATLHIPFGL